MAGGAVIDHQIAAAGDAHEELMQAAMRMLSANVLAGNVKHQKISLHLERDVSMDLAEAETSPKIAGPREPVNGAFTQRSRLLRVGNIQLGERSLTGRIHIPDNARRVSGHFRMRRNVSSHDSARAYHGFLSDHQARQHRGVRPNRSSAFDQRPGVFGRMLLAAREAVIRERRIRAVEDLVFHAQPIPQLDPALDRDPVPHDDVVFNERVIANVAVAADSGVRKDVGIRPDPCSFADVIGLDQRCRVELASGWSRCYLQEVTVGTTGVPLKSDFPGAAVPCAKNTASTIGVAQMQSILVIDDDESLRDTIGLMLENEGFRPILVADGKAGLEQAFATRPNLILVDLRMPGLSGVEVCKRIRAAGMKTPVIVLSAMGDEIDKVLLLEIGADDYVVKPFGTRELLARIRALLRRTTQGSDLVLSFADIEVDLDQRMVRRGGAETRMTRAEFNLLAFFLQNPGRALSRDVILNSVWGYESFPNTRTVDAHVVRLRQKLEPDPEIPRHFLTMHGVGYRFLP